jgi:diacylglycerol kinase family enzyme
MPSDGPPRASAGGPIICVVTTPPDPELATLIVSPLASRVRDERARRRIVRAAIEALGVRGHREVAVVETGDPQAIRGAAEAAVRGGSSLVVLAGGDGTVRDAAGAMAGTGVAVGIVPCGTGNLYATAIGVPRGVNAALAALATGRPRRFDVGEVRLVAPPGGPAATAAPPSGPEATGAPPSGREAAAALLPPEPVPFIVACGTGFDAQLIAATSREMKRRYGVAAYFLAASRLLGHLKPEPTVLTIDGVRTELESVVVLVANCGEAIPGVLRPRLPIEPDDGLLHVFVLPRGGVLDGIRGALELMTAAAAGFSPSGTAVRLAGTHVRVEVIPAGTTEVDGDPFPAAWLDARVHPGALHVILG